MVDNHYRWDFIGLSTDEKPTPETSEKVANGSTFYCSDNSKLYVWYNTQWYEKVIEGGGGGTSYTAGDGINISNNEISVDTDTIQPKLTAGTNITIDANNVISAEGGGGPTVVQGIGTSTTDVMSQDAATKMVYVNASRSKIKIGTSSSNFGTDSIGIGNGADAVGNYNVVIGSGAGISSSSISGAIALGYGAKVSEKGQFDVGTGYYSNSGYNNTNYRLLTGLYDGQSAHDAVTVEQVNATIDAINTALSTSIPHIGA